MTKPDSGEVLINGHNLYSPEGKQKLKGVIGFVPQDDLLFEDLTVYQNLYYNVKMCLDNLGETGIVDAVDRILVDFDLDVIRDLKVGNPLNKIISGGQRKRLNIALELIREPTILIVDEPTSGLSSVDAEAVMNMLKEQTYKGRLVLITIHQPGSDIYKTASHLAMYGKMDIALDTFPYPSITTACEALVMGVPMITMTGPSSVRRASIPCLHAVGLDDLICADEEQFINAAVALARDPARRVELRSTLRDRLLNSELGDRKGWTDNFSSALRGMWKTYCWEQTAKAR